MKLGFGKMMYSERVKKEKTQGLDVLDREGRQVLFFFFFLRMILSVAFRSCLETFYF